MREHAGSLLQLPESRREMPQKRRLLYDLESPNFRCMPIHFQNRFHHVIDMALSVNPARDRQAQQLMWSAFAEHHRPDFDRPVPGVAIQFDSQRLRWKLIARYVR